MATTKTKGNIFEKNLVGVDYCEKMVAETNPGVLDLANRTEAPNAAAHGYKTIGDIMRALNPLEGEFYRVFFQAEDGIRDYKVTGVQTCALPISDLVKTSHSAGPAVSCSARAARTRACSSPSSVWQRAPSRFRACSSSSFTSTRVTSRPMRASRAPNRVPMAPAPRMPMLLVFSIAVSPAGGFASGDLDLDHDGLGMGQRALQHIGQLGRVLHMHAVAALATGQRHEVDVGQFRALDLLALAVAEDMGEVLQRRVAAVLEDHEADGQAQLGCAPEGLDGIHGRAIADDGDHLGLGLCQRHAHGGRHAVAQAAAAHGVEGARVEDGQVGLDGGARAGRLFHHDAVAVAHLGRSEEDPSVLPSPCYLVCRLLF